ncbi:hypothetical protein ACFX11_016938 [Malus domestica]
MQNEDNIGEPFESSSPRHLKNKKRRFFSSPTGIIRASSFDFLLLIVFIDRCGSRFGRSFTPLLLQHDNERFILVFDACFQARIARVICHYLITSRSLVCVFPFGQVGVLVPLQMRILVFNSTFTHFAPAPTQELIVKH